MPTPLYDTLRSFADSAPLRMHMPGHKGRHLPLAEFSPLACLDVTELPPTGNLFEEGGPIQQAQELWARDFHMEQCLFLTGGSTQGLHTALALTARPGDTVLVDRGCHRCVHHAMALLDLRPVYLSRPWLEGPGVPGPMDPGAVERQLQDHPDVTTVCITSPTYHGILSDIPELARICHGRGVKLVVDGAHGAHLPFLGEYGNTAADVLVVSAHKTLPAPGQTALLLANGIPMEEIRRKGAVFGSSSPSYVMMAALDCVRDWMEGDGSAAYRRAAELTAALRRCTPSLGPEDAPMDPTRYVLCCRDGRRTELALQHMDIWPEMADSGHVVCILTCADGPEETDRLRAGLEKLGLLGAPRPAMRLEAPPPARQVLTPRQALFAPVERLPLERALGRVAGQSVAPYPPGVPVIAPGEQVDKKLLAYLDQIGYNDSIALVIPNGEKQPAGAAG